MSLFTSQAIRGLITSPSLSWQTFKIGAGAFLTGSQIVASNNRYIIRTDTGGAYIWDPSATTPKGNAGGTGAWKQLITQQSMPNLFQATGQKLFAGASGGPYEIQIAPSNSSVMYMLFPLVEPGSNTVHSTMYKSTDGGISWLPLNSFASVVSSTVDSNTSTTKTLGQKMAVHPTDPNTVVVGVGSGGLFYTINGGTNWINISTVPNASSGSAISGIAFQPGTPNTIYAASFGNGIYQTTTGVAGTWSKINVSSGPTAATAAIRCAVVSSDGTLYVVDDIAKNLWTYLGTTWTQRISGGVTVAVAIDPSNASRAIAIQDGGNLNETVNSGVSWGGWSALGSKTSTDIPWLSQSASGYSTNSAGILFDTVTLGKLYTNGARGFSTTAVSTGITGSTTVTWDDQSVGIEEVVGNDVVVPTSNGVPVALAWDSPTFYRNNLSIYPSVFGPVQDANVVAGWSCDYSASNPNFLVLLADGAYAGGPQRHSTSSNGGQTWSSYTAPFSTFGGCVAVSTPLNWIIATQNTQPQYTLDGGSTFNLITLPGVSSWSGFGQSAFTKGVRWVVADRVNANQFTLWFGGTGFFKTTNGGVSWVLLGTGDTDAGATASQIKSVTGQPNHIWWSRGFSGSQGQSEGTNGLKYSSNAGTSWTSVTNIAEAYSVGFGASAPGQAYPVVYVAGSYLYMGATSSSITIANSGNFNFTIATGLNILPNTPVALESVNNGNMFGLVTSYSPSTGIVNINVYGSTGSGSGLISWNLYFHGIWQTVAGQTATPVWTQIGTYPNNNLDLITGISGDPSIYGRVYVSFSGTGFAYYG